MRKILLALFIIITVYLNRAYAHIYDTIQSASLKGQDFRKVTLIKNSQGFEKTYKYVALGDSLSAGVGVKKYQESLPYLVSQNLQKTQTNVTLIGLAKPGATTKDVLKGQLPEAIAESPDFITLLIGTNDIHNLSSTVEFQQNYQQIIDQLIDRSHARIIVINIPYLGSSKLLYPPYNLLVDFRTQQFNQVIQKIVADKPVKLIDLYAKSKDSFGKNPMLYSSDQFHPSAEGYKLWEKLIDAD